MDTDVIAGDLFMDPLLNRPSSCMVDGLLDSHMSAGKAKEKLFITALAWLQSCHLHQCPVDTDAVTSARICTVSVYFAASSVFTK